jgi:putative tryptophan/tyrosine transport system substrate-binding protein
MNRRDFIGLVGGAAVAWPRAARAQQPKKPVVGFVHPGSADKSPFAEGSRRGLADAGYVEGRNVDIEYRWAEGKYDRLPALAADLVARHAAVIVAGGGSASVLPVKAATSTIPILFFAGADPVAVGLVASFNWPGGHITGVYLMVSDLVGKQLEILHEIKPAAATVGVLENLASRGAEARMKVLREAAATLGVKLDVLGASVDEDLPKVFAHLAEQNITALVLSPDPYLNGQRERIAALAAAGRVAVIAPFREYAAAGGLMTYGPDLTDGYRLLGDYAGQILKGANPATLPVQQSTKVEFVVNLKAAKALGLTLPLPLIGRADEVIE